MSTGILYISYYFPPVGTVGSLRNYNIARELSSVFQNSYLITTAFKPFVLTEQFDQGFLEIFELKQLDYRYLAQYITGNPSINNALNEKRNANTTILSSKLLDSYPGNIVWGEGGWLYVRNGIRKGIQLIESGKVTHVYSSYRPMADHYIAYKLKRRFPELNWIADFRDMPVDQHRRNVFFPGWHDNRYKEIFGTADLVVTVSNGLKGQLLKYNDNVLVVKNGIRKLFLPKNPALPDKFTVTYTGSLYPGFQDPSSFFRAVYDLLQNGLWKENDIQLVYAGKDFRIWEGFVKAFGLEGISINKGMVSLSESIRLQHESHLNLLLTWSGEHAKGILTGKLFEYLTAQKPVLCMVNGQKDEELEEMILINSRSAVFYNGDVQKVLNYLKTSHLNSTDKKLETQKIPASLMESLSWENQIKPLVNKILH
jgi:hypothetical protein